MIADAAARLRDEFDSLASLSAADSVGNVENMDARLDQALRGLSELAGLLHRFAKESGK